MDTKLIKPNIETKDKYIRAEDEKRLSKYSGIGSRSRCEIIISPSLSLMNEFTF